MSRQLDLTSLRSLVAVADTGGVTRAAGYLNLTQSAVSMQIKRLEEILDAPLLERLGRGVVLTPDGEALLPQARRMLELNDEVLRRFAAPSERQMITIGVPHDIVYPAIPEVLRQLNASFPHVKIVLNSSLTQILKDRFAEGEMDMILTTESEASPGAETLQTLPLVWCGAINGQAWRRRPIRLAFERRCVFRRSVQDALDHAGIAWEMAVDSDNFRSVSAMVSADLAVSTPIQSTMMRDWEEIRHDGALPDLGTVDVNLYTRPGQTDQVSEAVRGMLRHAFSSARSNAA
ncbi:MAG: LysR family transcriptional regulator [Rhodobacterales bacterium]|nr:MAG: LysR family transcriptional regulator [Rhodobacterales bacterium]